MTAQTNIPVEILRFIPIGDPNAVIYDTPIYFAGFRGDEIFWEIVPRDFEKSTGNFAGRGR